MMETILLFIFHNKGYVNCSKNNGKFYYPYLRFNESFTNNSLKSYLIKKYSLKIERHNITFLFDSSSLCSKIFSAIINLDNKQNIAFFKSFRTKKQSFVSFAQLNELQFDYGNLCATEFLFKNPNFKDAFAFVNHKKEFKCFSKQSERIAKMCFNLYSNIWQYDKPDVIVETKNTITGIECFEINASGTDKNGSICQREKKNMEGELLNSKRNIPKVVSRKFDNSLTNLWNDFIRTFNNHLKAEEYKNNLRLIDSSKRKSLGLFIEDTTLLGSYFKNINNATEILYLFYIKEFWDIFINDFGFLFAIFQCSSSNNDDMYFITRHDYMYLRSQKLLFSLDKINASFSNNPHLLGYSFEIKK